MSLGEQKIVGADRSTRNSLKPLALISTMGLTAVYAMLVSLHPLLSQSVVTIFCLLILWHYQVRRFHAIDLGLFGSLGFMFFIFVGYARHPRIKPYLLSDPIGIMRDVTSNTLRVSLEIRSVGCLR